MKEALIMKRVSILVACAIFAFPATQAVAGTWSWHSEVVQKLIERIQQHHGAKTTPASSAGSSARGSAPSSPRSR
jgi:hypothetical protein